jgi:hypoxanthine phosphoribosyltransferase
VEDIIDTGRTLFEVKKLFMLRGARDVKVVSLLNKPRRREVEIEGDYIGFEIPNKFVVGYGLDYNQKYRNLPFVGVLKPEIYE